MYDLSYSGRSFCDYFSVIDKFPSSVESLEVSVSLRGIYFTQIFVSQNMPRITCLKHSFDTLELMIDSYKVFQYYRA